MNNSTGITTKDGKYFVSSYASSRVLKEWNESEENFLLEGLAVDPRVLGIEIPISWNQFPYSKEWLVKKIPQHWSLQLTSLPAMMQASQQDPSFGLASNNEAVRQQAVLFFEKIKIFAEELQHDFGRKLISSVSLYSSPPNTVVQNRGNKESLQRSVQEIEAMDWKNISLNLEHCDAVQVQHAPEKGFLALEEEIEVLQKTENIGLVLNWGRSAIEKHSPEGPLEHLKLALQTGLLRGFVFSGCSNDSQSPYGYWKDSHTPPASLCPESLLRAEEVTAVLELITKENKEKNRRIFLGSKLSNRLEPLSIERSLELNLKALDFYESFA